MELISVCERRSFFEDLNDCCFGGFWHVHLSECSYEFIYTIIITTQIRANDIQHSHLHRKSFGIDEELATILPTQLYEFSFLLLLQLQMWWKKTTYNEMLSILWGPGVWLKQLSQAANKRRRIVCWNSFFVIDLHKTFVSTSKHLVRFEFPCDANSFCNEMDRIF